MSRTDLKILDQDSALDWDDLVSVGQDSSAFESEFSPSVKVSNMFAHEQYPPLGGPTVSPTEIHVNPPLSGSSTNLTSPYSNSVFDSPSEGYETSPFFSTDDVDSGEWYSLFPDASPDSGEHSSSAASATRDARGAFNPVETSPAVSTESPETSPRYRSTSSHKRSSTSGIRKRSAQLPPIVVDDPNDVVALKRARNTLAARKSRAKKAEKMEEMQATIDELKSQVEYWKSLAEAK